MVSGKSFDSASSRREAEYAKSGGKPYTWISPDGVEISTTIPPTTYPPREDTGLLAEAVLEQGAGEGRKLLEIGCGSGVILAWAMRLGWEVRGCDINPFSVAASRALIAESGGDIHWISEGGPGEDSLQDWAKDSPFELIIWNLPYLDPPANGEDSLGPLEEAGLLDLGDDGTDSLLLETLEGAGLLADGGMILLLHGENKSGQMLRSRWLERGWSSRVVKRTTLGGGEVIRVVALWRPWHGAPHNHVDEVDSTNLRMLESGGVSGQRLSAAKQLSGRGQRGRKWDTKRGDLACTWLLHDGQVGEIEPGQIQLSAGMAVLDSLASLSGMRLPSEGPNATTELANNDLFLKWPNDVWTSEGKICGILVEGRSDSDSQRIVLGIGINLGQDDTERGTLNEGSYLDASAAKWLGASCSIVDIEQILHASLASRLEMRSQLPAASNRGLMKCAFASIYSYAENRGKPQLQGDEVELIGLSKTGKLLIDKSGEEIELDDTDALNWP